MKYFIHKIKLIVLVFLIGMPGFLFSQSQPAVQLAYNRFYSFEEVTQILKDLVKKYPDFLKLESIGKSVQGRDMWAVTINNPKTGSETDKAAMYIDSGIHGNEVQGTEAILYTIDYLMTNYNKLDQVRQLVDQRVFYLVPMVNPDGRVHFFDTKNFGTGARSGMAPTDVDGDGLYDEDGYDDIDGDGLILQMRKKVKGGKYRISKLDPRLMEPVPPGETGDYELLGWEGYDRDGDGRVNEDGPGGYDMNRNWPTDWQPNYVQRGAGNFPLSYPETECVARFILDRPNIAGVQAYHNSGGMILRAPGSQYQPEFPAEDLRVYDYLGKKGEEILPFYRYMILWKDLYTVHGGFVNWVAEGLGIFSFTNELWSSNQYYNIIEEQRFGRNDPAFMERQAKRLQFDDYVELGAQFVDWKPFVHPQFGKIELGGWRRETNRVPPLFMLEELCHRNAVFTLFHADEMPLVSIDSVYVEKLDGNLRRVWVWIKNSRAMPTISAAASKNKLAQPDIITAKGPEILSAGIVENPYTPSVNRIPHKPERILLSDGIPGNQFKIVQWIVKGRGRMHIDLKSARGGTAGKEIQL